MKNMFIIHGYQATTKSHWFEWLASEMKAYGYYTEIVYLPDSKHPEADKWFNAIQARLDNNINEETLIVAHSLGVVSVLNYLSKLDAYPKIKGLFLISGFSEPLNNIPELNQYLAQTEIDFNKIFAQYIISIGGDQDPIVNIEATKRLSQALGIETKEIEHNGHFLDRDGYTKFEFLKNEIVKVIQNKNSEIGT
ncbi:RBBP9/YdeN family alpha/beta hydrolase [Staphylococcus caeli]|uniref:RBBP9/YdeN family alpha/beta hydrolase n=1 Tax=Staphylococcus caeli TaxID=2201815 RepID=UPI003F553B3F